MKITMEPLSVDRDFALRYAVYAATIKPYLDTMLDWTDDEHEAHIRENMQEPGGQCALVMDGARVGIVMVSERDGEIALDQIEILPEFQGKGIATAVIARLQERANREQKPISLSVFPQNMGARRLYERLGFVVTSEDEGQVRMIYQPPPREDDGNS